MTKRDFAFVIFVGVVAGFIGGIVGGAISGGEWHFYIDSFTGPGHVAGELASEDLPGG